MNTETQIDTLKEARALISNPDSWVQAWAATNGYGVECDPRSDSAVCWCLDGAVESVTGSLEVSYFDSVTETLTAAAQHNGYSDHVAFNDEPETTHADVMLFLDDVVKDLEQAS